MVTINRKIKQNILLVLILLACSAILFYIQHILLHNPEEALFLFFQELAFIPIDVIVVTLVIDNLLNSREKQKKVKKINVIVCMFFVECGSDIILLISEKIKNFNDLKQIINIDNLTNKNIMSVRKDLTSMDLKLELTPEHLKNISELFEKNKSLLISLLENPNLSEHDSFTDMLWSIFHLSDELKSRNSFDNLPQSDLAHLSIDIMRAYKLMIPEWLDYVKYLHKEYPYLHSLAARKNPFDENSSTIVY